MNNEATIVISTYNGESYIYEQLDSIRTQTFGSFEVIICDDCSTDKTFLMIQDYIKKYDLNWLLFQNKQNIGWRKNFINLITMASTKYIFFCDQDDIWESCKLEVMINILEKNKHINVLTSNYSLLYSDRKASHVLDKTLKGIKNDDSLVQVQMINKNYYIRRPGCTFCITKDFINKNKKYLDLNLPHDALFWKLALFTKSLYILNSPLIKWRRHINNASTKKNKTKAARFSEIALDLNFIVMYLEESQNDFVLKIKKFLILRYNFFETKKLHLWIKLFIFYRQLYVSTKSCIGDLYLCYLKKYH